MDIFRDILKRSDRSKKRRTFFMKMRNKTNFILLIILALLLVLACDADEETAQNNTNGDEVSVSDTSDQTTTDEETTDEDDSSGDDPDQAETDNAPTDGPTTVRFARGKTSRTYSKPIKRGESHTYYLTASAGQTMDIEIKSPQENAGFTVYNPGGSEISAAEETTEVRDFSGELENSGRHKIVVASGRDVTYNIVFKVSAKPKNLTPDEAAGGATKTVRFGRGKSSASYSNSVIRGERDTYILGARAGQFMTVSITSVENNASFQIIAPNGTELTPDDTNWREELPRNGHYKIIVGSGRGNATYTVRFKVEQSPIDH
jgi:hypothetical protein